MFQAKDSHGSRKPTKGSSWPGTIPSCNLSAALLLAEWPILGEISAILLEGRRQHGTDLLRSTRAGGRHATLFGAGIQPELRRGTVQGFRPEGVENLQSRTGTGEQRLATFNAAFPITKVHVDCARLRGCARPLTNTLGRFRSRDPHVSLGPSKQARPMMLLDSSRYPTPTEQSSPASCATITCRSPPSPGVCLQWCCCNR